MKDDAKLLRNCRILHQCELSKETGLFPAEYTFSFQIWGYFEIVFFFFVGTLPEACVFDDLSS